MNKSLLTLRAAGWTAQIAPGLGGNLTRLEYLGRPVLRPLENPAQLAADPFLFGSPILFPANRTRAGRFTFEGAVYQLPVNEPQHDAHLHGLVHLQTFAVLSCAEDEAALCFENQARVYPFPFRLTVRYRLSGRGAESFYLIENTGSRAMPFTFGLHTTFPEPEVFFVPLAAAQEKDAHHLPTGRILPLSPAERKCLSGAASRGQTHSGYYLSGGDTARIGPVHYQVSGAFDHWVLYNARGSAGLLCVEPQCGAVDGLNQQNGCRILQPGQQLRLSTRLTCPG